MPTKKSHIAKLEDFFKVLLKNGLKISPQNANSLEKNYNVRGIQYLLRISGLCTNHCKVG